MKNHFKGRKALFFQIVLISITLLTSYMNGKKSENMTSDLKPNIVVIMVDDLGYGDLGCYGSTINQTPNIVDKLALEGVKFTDYHANGPMCPPTRAAFLTGSYQYRLGERFEIALGPEDDGISSEKITLAEILESEGYETAIFGKWHLGEVSEEYLLNKQGFGVFKGLLYGDGDHHTHINRIGKKDWWFNEHIEMEKGYASDLITQYSVDYINENSDKPFFMFVSHLAIHFPWQGPNDPPHRKEGVDYRTDKWGIIPDKNNVKTHVNPC